ncbi:hypothetical protein CPLU01_02620 [Colletotrichum plurivorum]|uniref:Uncharacterized protein n=1 Tax=Colletotrichum plurivorum TaxID=2175906 RepID=A0A8H6KV90_9PEZI|nr:hypothetical protein CPLU01_02620 [Colletotrichum plurivorum]
MLSVENLEMGLSPTSAYWAGEGTRVTAENRRKVLSLETRSIPRDRAYESVCAVQDGTGELKAFIGVRIWKNPMSGNREVPKQLAATRSRRSDCKGSDNEDVFSLLEPHLCRDPRTRICSRISSRAPREQLRCGEPACYRLACKGKMLGTGQSAASIDRATSVTHHDPSLPSRRPTAINARRIAYGEWRYTNDLWPSPFTRQTAEV